MIVQAKKAIIHFDTEHNRRTRLPRRRRGPADRPEDDVVILNDKYLDIPIPNDDKLLLEKRIQELTTPEMIAEQVKVRD